MINTGGGTFDRTRRPIYFAASPRNGDAPGTPDHILIAVNELFTASEERRLNEHLDAGRRVLLDSGIFWLTNQHMRATGCTMDTALALPPEKIKGFTELFDRYVELATRYEDRLWGYIELDQGGRDNKIRTRKRLHDIGLSPMPVYHPLNDGWDYFDDIAGEYDRMCFGNVVQANTHVRLRLLHTLWERHCAYPDLWVHVLGLTCNPFCLPCPPDSCDSSSWQAAFRWKTITESAMLRPVGVMGDEWRYTTAETDGVSRDMGLHTTHYGETVTHLNGMWTDILHRQADLGAPMYPAQLYPLGKPS